MHTNLVVPNYNQRGNSPKDHENVDTLSECLIFLCQHQVSLLCTVSRKV